MPHATILQVGPMGGFLWGHAWSETDTVEREDSSRIFENRKCGREKARHCKRRLLKWSYVVHFPGAQI